MPENNEEMLRGLAEMAKGRSEIYGLLAMVYRSELTLKMIEQAKAPRFLTALSELGAEFGDDFLKRPDEQLVEELAVEYARLFIGPGKHISPHESVHHERDNGRWGTLWGESTVEVKKFIESSGLGYRPDYRGLPDHISVELEFMREMVLTEAESFSKGDEARAIYCLEIERKFMEEHLLRWIPKFCDKVVSQARSSFYREMARITGSFIQFDHETIVNHISEN